MSIKQTYLKNIKPEDQTEEMCLEYVKRFPLDVEYVSNQTEAICLAAVEFDGLNLKLIRNQTTKVCLAAINDNYLAISYVDNQTEELCIAALKKSYTALCYIENQTHNICMEAIKQNLASLQQIKNQTPEICMSAVEFNGYALKYIEKQTPEICLAAAKSNLLSIAFSKIFTDEVLLTYLFCHSEGVLNNQLWRKILEDKGVSHGKIIDEMRCNIKEYYLDDNDFINNIRKICLEIVSEFDNSYILYLNRKTPKAFEKSEELRSFYEKALLNQSINVNINTLPLDKVKKF